MKRVCIILVLCVFAFTTPFVLQGCGSGNDEAVPTGHDKYNPPMSRSGIRHEVIKVLYDSVTVHIGDTGHGSGVFISPDGIVMTAKHVMGDPNDELAVVWNVFGKSVPVKARWADPNRDLGFLLPDWPEVVQQATSCGDIAVPHSDIATGGAYVGDFVFIIGTPLDRELYGSVAFGIVSAFRDFDSAEAFRNPWDWHFMIQSDVITYPGYSGGPVYNMDSEIVGVLVGGRAVGISLCVPVRSTDINIDEIRRHLLANIEVSDPND